MATFTTTISKTATETETKAYIKWISDTVYWTLVRLTNFNDRTVTFLVEAAKKQQISSFHFYSCPLFSRKAKHEFHLLIDWKEYNRAIQVSTSPIVMVSHDGAHDDVANEVYRFLRSNGNRKPNHFAFTPSSTAPSNLGSNHGFSSGSGVISSQKEFISVRSRKTTAMSTRRTIS
ncbi:MAG: hypothetical protein FWH26_01820 [Oscillospiraceae bacterium]|nr:hypothetical protein [Oscillospiraceae bacterium]